MKALILDHYGKKQAPRLGDIPEPVPGPDDVLVEVERGHAVFEGTPTTATGA